MEMKLVFIAVLMSFAAPAAAIDVDITNNPNIDKTAIVGYQTSYRDETGAPCTVKYVQGPNGNSHLISNELCVGITEKQVFLDAMYAAADLRAITYAKSFNDLVRSADDPHYRCATVGVRNYLFSPHLSQKRPRNWYKVYSFSDDKKISEAAIGEWRLMPPGKTIISNAGHEGRGFGMVDMKIVHDCDAR
ncbi:hypothetical protein ABRZ00_12695 [Castellaniella ginsengisoli]|uniref:Uncharacterized protein n=1 Tax=Castellaniella ginsengisoli TaxID=546114 RepID=A0AB39DNR6_9BURK